MQQRFPEGALEVHGVLQRAELSAVRRGTHVLYQDGDIVLYVESPTIGLQAYEGQDIYLVGTVEKNVDDSDVHVLVVTEVRGQSDAEKEWVIPALSVTFHAPSAWVRHGDRSRVYFTESGSFLPIVGIDSSTDPLPFSGDFLVVDGIPAVRVFHEEHGGQQVYIEREKDGLVVTLTQGGAEDAAVRSAFLRLLRTMDIDGGGVSNSPRFSSGSLMPCGGPHGLLCPEGEFCAFSSLGEETGICILQSTTSS
ncbi:hypothetical protein COU77_03280 [Candidatus Peregrinibacteria bacterium CG10_big_fil_rev_8_21_14_0_10_49_16]|nr:MAG: hypothetical protein COW95_02075 [Candidatus Peregrinibacteria bacterium CG22_combo_CG10-13_8_21_14_all_49_11]PIR51911.1 MAG: hypothetical protein COU77_03280 [Candidatus Peregrinibacteria bacterium CG10_big_fil_rev_8_21_14_0_10_49_16]